MRKATFVALVISLATVTMLVAVPPASAGFEHRFSVFCRFSHWAIDDPIVSPMTTASHLHVFFGNTSTNRFSTYTSMRSGGTTCKIAADTAGYWVPSLFARDGSFVPPKSVNAYYRTTGIFDTLPVKAFPPDLRLVSDVHVWMCEDHQTFSIPPNCNTSERGYQYVGLRIVFPNCWDGVSLDSSDHRSHMAFGSSRKGCPSTHPISLPRLALNVRFATKDARGAVLSSGEPWTAHGDFWNTWDQVALERLVRECLGATAIRTCGALR
jgi:hypothetical protein